MPLSIADRKHLMPFGASVEIARAEQVSKSYVSAVMNDRVRPTTPPGKKRQRRVQVAIARKLGRTVDEVFPPEEAQLSDDEKWERFRQKQARAS